MKASPELAEKFRRLAIAIRDRAATEGRRVVHDGFDTLIKRVAPARDEQEPKSS